LDALKTTTIEPDLDQLFRLPLGEFTPARNTLATRLKKEGHKDESERVKGLPKPSVSAWAVNQLYWKRRQDFDALIDIGNRFRQAQGAQLAGKAGDLRELLDSRREMLSRLTRQAAAVLRESGHNPTPDMIRRITTTLDALATYGSLPQAPRAGRLTDDLDPPGFEALAALVPNVGAGGGRRAGEPSRVLTFQQKPREHRRPRKSSDPEEERRRLEEERRVQQAAARQAHREAEQGLKDARREVERAEAALKKAAARAKAATDEKDVMEKQFEKVAAEAEEATQEARRIAREAEEAAQRVTDAEREVERSRQKLNEFE
jgi:hypothetical protein